MIGAIIGDIVGSLYEFDNATEYLYPMGSYGTMFVEWVHRANRGIMRPYNSCGNGSAMRVGPVDWAFESSVMTCRCCV